MTDFTMREASSRFEPGRTITMSRIGITMQVFIEYPDI